MSLASSGAKVAWVVSIPNPETPGFQMMLLAFAVKALASMPATSWCVRVSTSIACHYLQEFKPHTIACASKGGQASEIPNHLQSRLLEG
eukprot:256449-Amphidinium_carterae.1